MLNKGVGTRTWPNAFAYVEPNKVRGAPRRAVGRRKAGVPSKFPAASSEEQFHFARRVIDSFSHRTRSFIFCPGRVTSCLRVSQPLVRQPSASNLASLPRRRYPCRMRPLRYAVNITLDGCCDHQAGVTDEELHRYWAEKLAQPDALLFGRITYEMMQSAWRWPANGLRPEGMAEWKEPFARTIDAASKYVVSSTLSQ